VIMPANDRINDAKQLLEDLLPALTIFNRILTTLDRLRIGKPVAVALRIGDTGHSGTALSRFADLQSLADAIGNRLIPIGATADEYGNRTVTVLTQMAGTGNFLGEAAKYSKTFGVIGRVVSGASAAANQLADDVGRTDLAPITRVERVAYRTVLTTGGGIAGGVGGRALGVWGGTVVGMVLLPGVGGPAGGVIGGLLGGMLFSKWGSELGDWAVDQSID
jgi:hypothetical protein